MGFLFNNQTPTGINFNSNPVTELRFNGTTVWTSGPPDYSQMYLTFEALEDSTFKNSANSTQYSTDGGTTWTTLAANTSSPTVTAGSKIMWKATLTPTEAGIGTFTGTGNFNVEGNLMSLLYGDDFVGQTDLTDKDYAFYRLFYSANIVNAQNLILPATTLASSCYNSMFYNCSSLTTAPTLPETTLAVGCYNSMFYNCSSLTTAPELPATLLTRYCYSSMFYGCTNLAYIKMMALAVNKRYESLTDWVYGVSNTGTFIKNSAATWNISGENGIPLDWTVIVQEV